MLDGSALSVRTDRVAALSTIVPGLVPCSGIMRGNKVLDTYVSNSALVSYLLKLAPRGTKSLLSSLNGEMSVRSFCFTKYCRYNC